MKQGTLNLLAAALLLAAPAGANGFKAMAKELGSKALDARIKRVAVMPFVAADGSGETEGWNISERFVTQLVRAGQVQAVERSLLKQLLQEHRLGQTGIIDAGALKKLGKVFSVDGIVTGSFVESGARVVIDARLIDVETGVIVAACEQEVDRDWFGASFAAGAQDQLFVPAPEFTVGVPKIEPVDAPELRDSLNDDPCADAGDRVDDLERQVLDVKARYWALRLKKGLDAASLKANPGSNITDLRLKREFYERLADWSSHKDIPELSPREVERFVAVDGKAFDLAQRCGI